ncbi:MAG: hypothetical protein WAW88_13260 [Nocardioides sp.]
MHGLLLTLIILTEDQIPADEDVVAGGWGAAVFFSLLLALAVLGWSLSKHLRKAQAAKDAGVFDDPTR